VSHLLFVSSNLAGRDSRIRRLALRFIAEWRRSRPEMRAIERNLFADPIPHVTAGTFGPASASPERLTEQQRRARARSDALIAELEAADAIVIAAPMQNFAIPSTLKAWIDHVARAGRTFRATDEGPVGLLADRPVFIVTGRAAFKTGAGAQAFDFHEPYLRAVLGALGLRDISFIYAEDQQEELDRMPSLTVAQEAGRTLLSAAA
jgi:FMN-dependent NADH-azoreductase